MKAYELMSQLAKIPGGTEIKVGICMTRDELEAGDQIEQGLYCRALDIDSVDEFGTISTEA